MLILAVIALSIIPTVLVLACCVASSRADRRATELINRREGRCPGESHTLTPAGSTPAPATNIQP
jgi:hypothetical protein